MNRLPISIFFSIFFLMNSLNSKTLYNFKKEDRFKGWSVVDDVVMGGRSSGTLVIDEDGYGIFYGYISLRNNGGFSSIRCDIKKIDIKEYNYLILKIKGDNKKYQFRVKSSYYDRHSYVKEFFASDVWSEVKIPLESMRPQFRGMRLNMRNFSGDSIVQFGILVGNKVEEDFMLMIDSIYLK